MSAIAERPPARDATDLEASLDGVLGRHPAVGLALAVVRRGRPAVFACRGLASIASGAEVTPDTVFRIASVSKLFTAVAIMQLWERGLVDLDAPANDALRAYRLVPLEPGWRPTSLRHLLTHTSGIPEVVDVRDLLHPSWGSFWSRPAIRSGAIGERMPSLAEYYRGRLRVAAEPGTAFAYSGHGFATLGQVVEDVTGQPLNRYLRDRVFDPLGMADSDLVRSERVGSRLASGYELGSRGPKAVTDREWLGGAGGGIYATVRDLARFAAAVLPGAADDGRMLQPVSLATMFEPHFQPHPGLPGMGLGFFLGDVGGHRTARHEGLLPGFVATLLVAPDDDLAVVALTNVDGAAYTWLPLEAERLLRQLLELPEDAGRPAVPHHPERWPELAGRYVMQPRIADLRARVALRGIDVAVRIQTVIPGLVRAFPLEPDDARDPDLFRLDLSPLGLPVVRVAFGRGPDGRVLAAHTDLTMQSFLKLSPRTGPSPWLAGALAAAGLVAAARLARRRGHRSTETPI